MMQPREDLSPALSRGEGVISDPALGGLTPALVRRISHEYRGDLTPALSGGEGVISYPALGGLTQAYCGEEGVISDPALGGLVI